MKAGGDLVGGGQIAIQCSAEEAVWDLLWEVPLSTLYSAE